MLTATLQQPTHVAIAESYTINAGIVKQLIKDREFKKFNSRQAYNRQLKKAILKHKNSFIGKLESVDVKTVSTAFSVVEVTIDGRLISLFAFGIN
ncbi:TPA: hypothetical protein IWM33_002376 [Enterococcus faecium]|nr:hypothetical protein [Enterococcus faecium]HAP6956894.1 hypothetical protein [Enterococcus faecium]HAP7045517.1 hypothetical protein [Enterococcus faecium]HAP7329283.1 hypothetical protein [Enterococcus faecium]HAP7395556.1 hypothetical protein [Enterococcus faecium]